jgi:hypothetical protein
MPGEQVLIFDERILETPEVKEMLKQGKIEIIDD